MTTAEVLEWTEQVCFLYGSSPSVTLSVVGSSGSLASLDDTRLAAGATSQSATAFPNEATTAEPTTVTVTYDKVSQANASVSPTTDTGTTWPVYINGDNDLQAMNLADIKDTFLHPAINLLVSGTESATTAGTYTVTTSTTPASNYTNVSTTAIFVDTRADTAAYSAAGIPETLDQPTTITSYYLHIRTGTDTAPARDPVFITGTNDIQTFTEGTIDGLFTEWIRETASESTDGFQITYTVATSGGNTRGTAMVDTKLDGAGEHRTLQVGDDYRAQEHPNGSAQTITTTALRINKA
ncbi:uncharacterized protein METZ01_LOCUS134876 [marine metagenome]|uniref:Uncharacterized protein n=1 Tax=marine metagenome TaxID=408172 RepID=A0A381YZG4_9ZZZZ